MSIWTGCNISSTHVFHARFETKSRINMRPTHPFRRLRRNILQYVYTLFVWFICVFLRNTKLEKRKNYKITYRNFATKPFGYSSKIIYILNNVFPLGLEPQNICHIHARWSCCWNPKQAVVRRNESDVGMSLNLFAFTSVKIDNSIIWLLFPVTDRQTAFRNAFI